MMPVPSRYTPIWEKLKATGKCSITAPLPLHKRIIKAVIKRKYQDMGFRLMLAENSKWAKLIYSKQGSVIHFTLRQGIGLEDL